MTKNSMKATLRQGDVMLVPTGHSQFKSPTGQMTAVVSEVAGRHVLAYGEVTGHHHSVSENVGTLTRDEEGVTYLTIDQLTEVVHQEHSAIVLDPGIYEVRRQREWSDEQLPRNVAD